MERIQHHKKKGEEIKSNWSILTTILVKTADTEVNAAKIGTEL